MYPMELSWTTGLHVFTYTYHAITQLTTTVSTSWNSIKWIGASCSLPSLQYALLIDMHKLYQLSDYTLNRRWHHIETPPQVLTWTALPGLQVPSLLLLSEKRLAKKAACVQSTALFSEWIMLVWSPEVVQHESSNTLQCHNFRTYTHTWCIMRLYSTASIFIFSIIRSMGNFSAGSLVLLPGTLISNALCHTPLSGGWECYRSPKHTFQTPSQDTRAMLCNKWELGMINHMLSSGRALNRIPDI